MYCSGGKISFFGAYAVYDENGKIATGVPVKMYNEKDYKVFEKDNLTLPTAIIQTNESGMATFVLPREEWFATQSQRFLTFVVQELSLIHI